MSASKGMTDVETIREFLRIAERNTVHYHAAVAALDRIAARTVPEPNPPGLEPPAGGDQK